MNRLVRVLAALAFPIAFAMELAFRFAFPHGRADIEAFLLPAVVIYVLALPILWPRVKSFAPMELGALSFAAGLLSFVAMALSFAIAYARGNSYRADMVFMYFIPFVPPVIAVYAAYRATRAWHDRRLPGRTDVQV